MEEQPGGMQQETAMQSNVHVTPYREGWDVIHEGARYADSHHATEAEAVAAAAALARREHVELLIHGRDGQIRLHHAVGQAGDKVPG
jgi:hypothetical protein